MLSYKASRIFQESLEWCSRKKLGRNRIVRLRFLPKIPAGSITAATGAMVDGRLLAEHGGATLDDNTITAPPAEDIGGTSVPDSGSTLLLLGSSCAALCAFRRRLLSKIPN
jgi:hypothetical protein